jgi:uncharacterized protein
MPLSVAVQPGGPTLEGDELHYCEFLAIIDRMTEEALLVDASMLLAFRAENVRSFRDPVELSLLATPLAEEDVPRLVRWRENGRPIRVLPAAGVFGANASGKSNLLRAMHDMRMLVVQSFRSHAPGRGVPRHAFRLGRENDSAPSSFEIDLVLNGIRHQYGFMVDDDRVLDEWAYRYPRGKAALLFRRVGDEVTLGERNRAKGRAVTEILRNDSLLLSAAAAANHPDLLPLWEWFTRNLLLTEAANRPYRWAYTAGMLQEEQHRQQVLALLQAADLGITDARVRELDPQMVERIRKAQRILQGREEAEGKDQEPAEVEPLVTLTHRGAAGDVEFDSADESLGTMVWLGLSGPILEAIARGEVLLVDEIEASLHPGLVTQLVKLFQSPESNPKGAQIIFNSHEASLLGDSRGDRVLGRDQVWFTEKAHDGATRLFPLADLSPRTDEAIERRYRSGRYGATPILATEEFAEAVLNAAGEPR